MLVARGKPRYLDHRRNLPGRMTISSIRHLLALALVILVGLAGVAPASAFDVVTAPEDVNAVDLTSAVEVAPGNNGIIRRVEVLASQNGTNPTWALFALKNDSDAQMDRLLVAPFFRLPGS